MPAYVYTQTIDRNPQKKYGGDVSLDLDGCSIEEAIAKLQSVDIPSNAIDPKIDIKWGDEHNSGSIKVEWYRMETPAEAQDRVQRAERYNDSVRQRRLVEYQQLKQEFEGE